MKFSNRHDEKIRYLVVGGWNTAFGYLFFVALYQLLQEKVHYNFILTIGYIISITNAYICYKFLVFKTRGNFAREYFRFYLVYGAAFLINLALLSLSVEIFDISPIASQTVIVFFTVIISYFGHKNFSFGLSRKEPNNVED